MQKANAEPGPSTSRADSTRHAWTHFVVRHGSLTRVTDYDDGWQMALAFHSQAVPDVGAIVDQFTPHRLFSPTVTQVVITNSSSKTQIFNLHTNTPLLGFGPEYR